MILRQGDKGDQVKALQRGLNKLGQLLIVDGDFGGGTCDAVGAARNQLNLPGSSSEADDALQDAIAGVPDLFPPLTAAGVTFIAREEVTDARTYGTKYQTPAAPPAPSGVTIGLGYDCRFATQSQFQADWQGLLPPDALAKLETVLGKEVSPALKASVAGVLIKKLSYFSSKIFFLFLHPFVALGFVLRHIRLYLAFIQSHTAKLYRTWG